LTEDIESAPHDIDVLERYPQVGTLKPEKDPMDENVPDFLLAVLHRIPMLRRHPHPMTVHFIIAFVMAFPIFNLLYLVTGKRAFETTAFHLLAACLLAAPVAMITGPYNWWLNYAGKWTRVIAIKFFGSLALFVLIIFLLTWRVVAPDVMLQPSGARLVYLFVGLTLPVIVAVLGWFGAKMTFPH
jgi:uncharacterized membrane protein